MIAWALIGEWALRELFPPPSKGGWPNHGHDGKLSDSFKDRRPGLVGWARAAFLISLPRGYMRPVVVHGYGGAKVDLPASLCDAV